MDEEKTEELIEEQSGELEDFRRYIEDFTSFLPLAFCMVNPLDYILDSNKAFQDITGYEKMEVIGNSADFLFKNKGKIEAFIAKVASRKSIVEEEMTLITKEKREIPVKISALSRKDDDGNFSGYFLTITDITESKRFEEELERKIKERTEELQRAKERLEDSEKVLEVKIAARTRELAELNEKLETRVAQRTKEIEEKAEELEKKAEEMRQTQTAILNLAEDTDKASREAEKEKEKTLAIIKNFIDGLFFFDSEKKLVLANPKAEEMFDIKLRDVSGRTTKELRTFPTLEILINLIGEEIKEIFREEICTESEMFFEITTIPIKQDKEDIGTLINIHDITREKSIEKIKSEFVSVAAHQLRTPLAGIKWTLQTILEEEEDAQIPEEIIGFIRKAYEANDRMVNLVNDLLNVTRIEEGRYVYEPEELEFMDVVNPIIEAYKEHIKNKGLEFEMKKPEEDLPRVKVDREKIGIVVQNFLDNAMKYTNEGKVSLVIEHSEGKIKVSVTDNGVGIPEDQQKRLFNKFFRAANVQRMDTEGSGLGLFVAKNIIESHGGKVGFSSKAGEGSTFYFTLPANKEEIDSFFKNL
jgi:PAS domain S-box-containing protein